MCQNFTMTDGTSSYFVHYNQKTAPFLGPGAFFRLNLKERARVLANQNNIDDDSPIRHAAAIQMAMARLSRGPGENTANYPRNSTLPNISPELRDAITKFSGPFVDLSA